ncbi:MAG: FAD-dependent oxidoreductase, partial [Bacteroidales bacterium]|nr:FAD-dependent oxidoreductase [Bacteroidales bacterium]
MKFDLIVLGSGPGGYVAAIRASQLGMNVAVVEKAELGGICLNWGCIPTKALLKSAQVYNYFKHCEDYGITNEGNAKPDFNKVVARSREIASNMSKGIEYLFKKNKITVYKGFGKLISKDKILVTKDDASVEELISNHIILATGARSKQMQGFEQNGKNIIGYREALSL